MQAVSGCKKCCAACAVHMRALWCRVPRCSRQSSVIPLPPQCDAPLPETAGAFLKLREKADSCLYCSSRNPAHFPSLNACQWVQIHAHAHSSWCLTPCEHPFLSSLMSTCTHWPGEYLMPVASECRNSSDNTATYWPERGTFQGSVGFVLLCVILSVFAAFFQSSFTCVWPLPFALNGKN